VGLLTATALVGSVGDLRRFPSARHFASSLGLTPRESSSGNVRRLGRITKRGAPYLRTLLIHGARSVLHPAKRAPKPDRLRAWALERDQARGHNKGRRSGREQAGPHRLGGRRARGGLRRSIRGARRPISNPTRARQQHPNLMVYR